MMNLPLHTALILSTSFLATPVTLGGVDDEDLKVRRITLYRSGVGYFELAGEVRGDRSFQLKFDTDRINDILKSMTILDLGDGQIGPVSYGSKEPLERQLGSFGVNISGTPDNASLFAQLRGTDLHVTTAEGSTIEGTILGVEIRPTVSPAGDDAVVLNQQHVNLLTDAGVRSIALGSIVTWRLLDEELAAELRLALGALNEQRAERIKAVDLSFFGADDQDRTVVVSYIHEMPVWKTSYRLVLPEKEGDAPKLQGWAIVENTTDEEWTGVQLSLASGRPSSFTMDLYEPIFTQRPNVPVPTEAGLVARNYASERPRSQTATRGDNADGGPASPGSPRMFGGRSRGRAVTGGVQAELDGDKASWSGVEGNSLGDSHATGEQAGGVFLYTVNTPVTLERQRSAMLPISLADISGRRVSIFNPTDGSDHPLLGVEMTNDTQLHLMPGPIAVFDSGTYAGDAQIPHTARNQKRLLAYALDLDVGASNETKGTQQLVAIKIVDGLLEQRTKFRNSMTYSFINYDASKDRTVLVEHGRHQGWDLITPEDPHDSTASLYRFELPLPAGEEASLTVTEELVQASHYQLANMSLDTLLDHRRNGKASDAVVEAVSTAAALQAKVGEYQNDIDLLDQERERITAEQSRIRENLARIQQDSDLYRRYVQKLGEQEDRLEEIIDQQRTLQDAREAAQEKLQDFLRDLDVE